MTPTLYNVDPAQTLGNLYIPFESFDMDQAQMLHGNGITFHVREGRVEIDHTPRLMLMFRDELSGIQSLEDYCEYFAVDSMEDWINATSEYDKDYAKYGEVLEEIQLDFHLPSNAQLDLDRRRVREFYGDPKNFPPTGYPRVHI